MTTKLTDRLREIRETWDSANSPRQILSYYDLLHGRRDLNKLLAVVEILNNALEIYAYSDTEPYPEDAQEALEKAEEILK